jgi:hypothetical protein
MHHVPQRGLTVPAVVGQLERGVRRHWGERMVLQDLLPKLYVASRVLLAGLTLSFYPLAVADSVEDGKQSGREDRLGEYVCPDTKQVKVVAHSQSDAESACIGATRALRFLGKVGLSVSSTVTIEVVAGLPGELAERAVGGYLRQSGRVLILSFDSFQRGGSWYQLPTTAELHRAVFAHETAHAVVSRNSGAIDLSIAAHEYVAYVVLFETMDPRLRQTVLKKFPGNGFASAAEISELAHTVNPNQFGINAWKHFRRKQSRHAWIREVVAGEAIAAVVADPGAEDR